MIIDNKDNWNKFVLNSENSNFLQSWEWGEIVSSKKEKPYRLAIVDKNDNITAGMQLFHTIAKRGDFLYCPYGPLGDKSRFSDLILLAKDLARKLNVVVLRVQPPSLIDMKEYHNDFIEAPLFINSDNFWIKKIDDREKMLAEMRQTHRNLARRTEKEDCELDFVSGGAELIMDFFKLMKITEERQGFKSFNERMFINEIEKFGNNAKIFLAKDKDNNPLAGAIIVFWKDMANYHHGASVLTKLPASNGVLWRALLEAKSRDMKYFNFWGIAPPESSKNHRFAGITPFKRGWGGEYVELSPLQDLPIKKMRYKIMRFIEIARKIKRRL